jgi:hypothetical protein
MAKVAMKAPAKMVQKTSMPKAKSAGPKQPMDKMAKKSLRSY